MLESSLHFTFPERRRHQPSGLSVQKVWCPCSHRKCRESFEIVMIQLLYNWNERKGNFQWAFRRISTASSHLIIFPNNSWQKWNIPSHLCLQDFNVFLLFFCPCYYYYYYYFSIHSASASASAQPILNIFIMTRTRTRTTPEKMKNQHQIIMYARNINILPLPGARSWMRSEKENERMSSQSSQRFHWLRHISSQDSRISTWRHSSLPSNE